MKTKAIYWLITIAIFLAIQEIAFRLIFPIPEVENFNRIYYSPLFFQGKQTELKKLSNASFIWASDPDGAAYVNYLNLYGFRDGDWSVEKSDKPRVIFVGDSFVEGFMAPADSSIPSVFRRVAYENFDDLETMNLGIGGIEFNGYFKVIRDAAKLFKPDYLFLIVNSNDLPTPKFRKEYLFGDFTPKFNDFFEPRVLKVVAEYFRGETVAKAWHSEPFFFFAPVPSLRNPWSNAKDARRWSQFVDPDIAEAMKKGRFNPFSVNEYDRYEKNLRDSVDPSEHLAALRNFADEENFKVFLAYVPSRSQVSDKYLKYQARFSETKNPKPLTGPEYQRHARILKYNCERLGIPFFDFTPIFREAEKKGTRLYWNYDEHLNGKGYSLAARSLYKWFKSLDN